MSETTSLEPHVHTRRLRIVWISVYVCLGLIVTRLFYWQIIKGTALQAQAQDQYQRTQTISGSRGQIFTSDGSLLVGNQTVYRLFAQPQLLEKSPQEITEQVLPVLLANWREYQQATESADRQVIAETLKNQLLARLGKSDSKWVSLMPGLSADTRAQLAQLDIAGLGFEPGEVRFYPEASLAAHITGFVGRNDADQPTGYFGIEGALDKELQSRSSKRIVEKDALGFHLWGQSAVTDRPAGRNVVLTIRRDIQRLAVQMLYRGIERYGAKAGEIIIMEPATGKILALATYPNYDPTYFNEFPGEVYKLPSVSDAYEPGSTFKTLTVAAGIDAGVIKPDTPCPVCDGPRQIGKYSIKTWNNEYHPNITMTEALAKSDNTAMIFVTDLLGADLFKDYLRKFGVGERTYADWQEDSSPPFPSKWGPVELATISFGQGISTTSLQLVKAINAIANHGVVMRPMIVEKVEDPVTGEELVAQPIVEQVAIRPETAQLVTQMMEVAAASGEAKWTAAKTHRVAAKTGTSQIAIDGTYDETKTVASFIGFAPPENPKFIMLVKLTEPTSSVWAAETAAPLWYQLAEKLFLMLEMPPDKN